MAPAFVFADRDGGVTYCGMLQADAVKPVTATRDGIGPESSHLFPAYSYTILSIDTLTDQPPQ